MASTSTPRILTFRATGTINKGCVVKIGATRDYVVQCTLPGDKAFGIAQGDALIGEPIEVAIGDGAKAKAGGTISAGDPLVATASGAVIVSTAAGDRVVGWAMESAVIGDIFACEIGIQQK